MIQCMKKYIVCIKIFLAIIINTSVSFSAEAVKSAEPVYDEVLRLDVWTSYAPKEAIEDFKAIIFKKYAKKINVEARVVLSPNEFFDRVRAGDTDVFSPSHNFLKDERTDFIKHQLVIPLTKKDIPNLVNVEKRYINNAFVTEDNQLYAIPAAAGGYSLLFNKLLLKKAPRSWDVLWDPKNKKKYAISKDFYEANIYITALALGYTKEDIDNISIEKIDTPVFKAKLRQLLENAVFWQGAPKEEDLKGVIFTTAWGVSNSVKNDVSKKWLFAFPKEGLTLWTDYLSVTTAVNKKPFVKKLAFEWLNFVLSKEYQSKYITEASRYLSPTPYAISKGVFGEGTNETALKYFNTNAIYWPILSVRNRNGLKFVHDEALKNISP